jgi:uncharacterized 2Fe-2S/4Fe-4S cluster protein (DUF4445 family)
LSCKVTFVPDNLTVTAAKGTTLRQAAAMAGIELKSNCGGEGTCGQCLVKVVAGSAHAARYLEGNVPAKRRAEGYVPACRSQVAGDLTIEVPDFARLTGHRVLLEKIRQGEVLTEEGDDLVGRFGLDPLLRRVDLKLDAPTLTENASDWTRLVAALRREAGAPALSVGADLEFLRRLPRVLREGDWNVAVWLRGWGGVEALRAAGRGASGNGSAEATFSDVAPKVLAVDVAPLAGAGKSTGQGAGTGAAGKGGGSAASGSFGLAVDIGTTSVVASLLDLDHGTTLATRGTFNRQARYGDDVITRIIHAGENPQGLDDLNAAVVESINELVDGLTAAAGVRATDIRAVVAAGNTTMEHFFLRLPPDFIRLEPYIPAAIEFPIVAAGALGLWVNPVAPVRCVPSVASYVGGDITAGVLVTGVAERDEVTLFIDIGTNGEMVLGNRDWMVSCACSAGPCFEGGGITHGLRAVPGAIERVEVGPGYEVEVATVGGAEPKGICGSGLVDALAKLREAGIIDRAGKFHEVDSPRYRLGPDGPEFVLWRSAAAVGDAAGGAVGGAVGGAAGGAVGGAAGGAVGGATGGGRRDSGAPGEIVITEADVKNLIRAKGAVYAGIRSLLAAVNLGLGDIHRIYIAGGFGNYLNVRDAVRIGMLPDVAPSRYRFVGNTSAKGARAALLSRKAFETTRELAAMMTYLELSAGRGFMEEFVSALFLPHTDLTQFPSVPG